MLLTNAQQLLPLFYGMGYGVWIGLVYAVFVALRRHRRVSPIGRFFQDAMLSLFAGIGFFVWLLPITGGTFRLSVSMSAAVGCGGSYRLLHRPITLTATVGFRAFAAVDSVLRRLSTNSTRFLQKSCKKALFFSKKGLQSAFYMLYNKKST